MNALVQLFASASRDAAHLSRGNAEKLDQLMRAHVTGFFEVFRVQGTKPELGRQLIQNHHSGIERVRDGSIEVENDELGAARAVRAWRLRRRNPLRLRT